MQNCDQDRNAVGGGHNHTLRTLKEEHPEITKAYNLNQDNAFFLLPVVRERNADTMS